MSQFLIIESSRACCSVALLQGETLFEKQEDGLRSHTQHMMPFIDEVLAESGLSVFDLDAIAFSAGPGSFTGIRLATSVAKSLAYAADKPVIPFSSLDLQFMYYKNMANDNAASKVLVISDARMGEVFLAAYACIDGQWQSELADDIMPMQALRGLDFEPDIIISDSLPAGFEKSVYADVPVVEVKPTAADAVELVNQLWQKNAITTALLAEPVYLRDKSGWKNKKEQKQLKP